MLETTRLIRKLSSVSATCCMIETKPLAPGVNAKRCETKATALTAKLTMFAKARETIRLSRMFPVHCAISRFTSTARSMVIIAEAITSTGSTGVAQGCTFKIQSLLSMLEANLLRPWGLKRNRQKSQVV